MQRAIVMLCLFVFVSLTQTSRAQSASTQPPAPRRYAVLEYMKIEPGKAADYRKNDRVAGNGWQGK
ncbi:MAG TPA: hypothetical protein VFZ34_21625 [Blastocatellia bacterium]|nr:hypothetical protein [Blastocatellia bacterium]